MKYFAFLSLISLVAANGSIACGTGGECPSSAPCCSKYGYCGSTADYCSKDGGNCVSGCWPAQGGSGAGQCDSHGKCPSGLCCSKWGYCGSTFDYCSVDAGCQSGCWKGSQDGKCAYGGPLCGSAAPCCSKWGYCGNSSDYCSKDKGCQFGCWEEKKKIVKDRGDVKTDFTLNINTAFTNTGFPLGFAPTAFDCQQLCAVDTECNAYGWIGFLTGIQSTQLTDEQNLFVQSIPNFVESINCYGFTEKKPDLYTMPYPNVVSGYRTDAPRNSCRETFALAPFMSNIVDLSNYSIEPGLVNNGPVTTETACQLICLRDHSCVSYTALYNPEMQNFLCFTFASNYFALHTDENALTGHRGTICLDENDSSSSSSSSSN